MSTPAPPTRNAALLLAGTLALVIGACAPSADPSCGAAAPLATARSVEAVLFMPLAAPDASAIAIWQGLRDPRRLIESLPASALTSPDRTTLERILQAAIAVEDWPLSLAAGEALLQIVPDHEAAHSALGLALVGSDPLRAALYLAASPIADENPELIELAQTAPTNEAAQAASRLLAAHNRLAYAELAARHVIESDFADALGWAWLATLRARQGKAYGAEMLQALALDPANAGVRSLQGLALLADRNTADALEILRFAQALAPEDRDIALLLADAYRDAGQATQADAWSAYAAQPGAARPVAGDEVDFVGRAAATIAGSVAAQGDEALAGVAVGLVAYREHPLIALALGRIRLQLGDVDEARALFGQVAAGTSAYAAEAAMELERLTDRPAQ
jgi:tetratricopeptide (TPR) repeat protein